MKWYNNQWILFYDYINCCCRLTIHTINSHSSQIAGWLLNLTHQSCNSWRWYVPPQTSKITSRLFMFTWLWMLAPSPLNIILIAISCHLAPHSFIAYGTSTLWLLLFNSYIFCFPPHYPRLAIFYHPQFDCCVITFRKDNMPADACYPRPPANYYMVPDIVAFVFSRWMGSVLYHVEGRIGKLICINQRIIDRKA